MTEPLFVRPAESPETIKEEITLVVNALLQIKAGLDAGHPIEAFYDDVDEIACYRTVYDLCAALPHPDGCFSRRDFPRPAPTEAENKFVKDLLGPDSADLFACHTASQQILTAALKQRWHLMATITKATNDPNAPYNGFHSIREDLGYAPASAELLAILAIDVDTYRRIDRTCAFEEIANEMQNNSLSAFIREQFHPGGNPPKFLRNIFDQIQSDGGLGTSVEDILDNDFVQNIMHQSGLTVLEVQTYVSAMNGAQASPRAGGPKPALN